VTADTCLVGSRPHGEAVLLGRTAMAVAAGDLLALGVVEGLFRLVVLMVAALAFVLAKLDMPGVHREVEACRRD